MSKYQRFISYINLFEENRKIRNVGFAKIEQWEAKCSLKVHIQNCGYMGLDCPLYLFVRKEGKVQKILLGRIPLNRGRGEGSFNFEKDNIKDSGFSLEQVGGFLIQVTENVCLVSQWEEENFVREDFFQENSSKEEKQEETEKLRKVEEEKEAERKKKLEEEKEAERKKKLEEEKEAERKKKIEEEKEAERKKKLEETERLKTKTQIQMSEKTKNMQATEAIPIIQREEEATLEKDMQEEIPENWELKWRFLVENYPDMTPFEGEDITCIRIELKDLRQLPKKYWYLGNNSFLLHGFFNYRYLILGCMVQEGKKRWFIGVPGVFQNQEKVMAVLFGFPEYKSEKNTVQKTGQFGYWYRFMDE